MFAPGMKRAQKSKDLTFALRDPTDPPLTELPWEADGVHCLQLELQKVLIRAELCPLDLLRGYDSDGGGTFTRKEFVVMMKRIVNDDDLWDEVLRDVVKSAFQTISGGDKSIDIVEFERFLNKGWLQLKASMISTSTAAQHDRQDSQCLIACSRRHIYAVGSHLVADEWSHVQHENGSGKDERSCQCGELVGARPRVHGSLHPAAICAEARFQEAGSTCAGG